MAESVQQQPNGRESSFTVRQAEAADAAVLARLMADAIHWGGLRDLGQRFLTLLHRHFVASRHASCWVAEDTHAVVGYVAAVVDTSKFHWDFLLKRGVIATAVLLPKILHPRQIRTIYRSLTYLPSGHPDDPRAEIVSFAVRPNVQHAGVGKALFRAVVADLRARGVPDLKVGTVEVLNEKANAFYQRIGCELVRTVPFYADSQVNVYVHRIASKEGPAVRPPA